MPDYPDFRDLRRGRPLQPPQTPRACICELLPDLAADLEQIKAEIEALTLKIGRTMDRAQAAVHREEARRAVDGYQHPDGFEFDRNPRF